jgi:hypothetical protein
MATLLACAKVEQDCLSKQDSRAAGRALMQIKNVVRCVI